jgi:hypothetical protein
MSERGASCLAACGLARQLIALAEGSTERGSPRRLSDLDGGLLGQIEAFFTEDNRLRGRRFKPIARRGPQAARRLIKVARFT